MLYWSLSRVLINWRRKMQEKAEKRKQKLKTKPVLILLCIIEYIYTKRQTVKPHALSPKINCSMCSFNFDRKIQQNIPYFA